MYCTVITSSKSAGIGNGLLYEVMEDLAPGSPVRVPLRNKIVEGIVIDVLKERTREEYDLKGVREIVGHEPLLTPAQLKTIRWMAEHYLTSLRQALSVWLPSPSWSRLLTEKQLSRSTKSPAPLRRRKKHLVIAVPKLTEAQAAAYKAIRLDDRPSLLFGVTGSGKTEIYAKLIADVINDGGQAILLVPEILLTEPTIHRLSEFIERDAIAVLHSRFTDKQRRDEWRRIRRGEVSLVIGSRSALFAPLQKLKLVILDEEHEWTYKNEQTPRYHARETAEVLCRNAEAKLVLGSATPSLESWARAKNGQYHLARLPERFREAALPTVRVIDLKDVNFGTLYPFSPPLLSAIEDRLKKGEQTVLFLNRRGIATSLLCMECRRRVTSPDSLLPFTVHHTSQGKPYLMDHTTGLIGDVPEKCPHCGSQNLRQVGAGTQKIEKILALRFPTARLLRADADTLTHPEQMRSLLKKMRERQADILLGTQSVVKGLDLPEVTLAAVILADVGLSLPHFRAGERIMQLLTQLTGRSGRRKPGEVIIQTFRPQAPEVVSAAKHEVEPYLDSELKLRLFTGYPPATTMIRLLVRGEDAAARAKDVFQQLLKAMTDRMTDTKVSVAPTFFGGGREWHVLLRGTAPRELLRDLDLNDVSVDVDPMETM